MTNAYTDSVTYWYSAAVKINDDIFMLIYNLKSHSDLS